MVNALKKIYRQSPGKVIGSFFLSFVFMAIGIFNDLNNQIVINSVGKILGPIGELIVLLAINGFGISCAVIGSFVYPGQAWYYFGQFIGFLVVGISSSLVLHVLSRSLKKKV